jgi:very-short-patch-repair endonuclease
VAAPPAGLQPRPLSARRRSLRHRKLGDESRRQYPIDRLIIHFYGGQARHCVEVDAQSHRQPEQTTYDTARVAFLDTLGSPMLRFVNDDVRYNPNGSWMPSY